MPDSRMKRNNLATGLRMLATRSSVLLGRARAQAAKLRARGGGMGPPTVTWPDADSPRARALTCPNCGSDVAKPQLLTIEFTTSPGSRKQTAVLRCPDCACSFYADQIPPDYAEDAMLARGRVPFYLQQGAGLSLITRPLAQLAAPPASTYVEVGCGFGFGLDYARHAKGWNGQGIDPAGISALGRDMLGVPIQRRYLADAEPALSGTCDVVMASETIEHVPSPIGFVRVLRSMLRPGGVLVLTTPDGADLTPDTAPGVLIGLLSPGLHLIFQTRESLRRILLQAGFAHATINKDGHSLVAFASDRPVELALDEAALKAEYRNYLERRAADFPPEHDLYLAFAGRALQEAVNDAAFDQAHRVHSGVQRACVARFKLPLEALAERVAECGGVPLEDLARRMPLSLGGLLYADAMMRLAAGTPRAGLGEAFLRAAAAAELLRDALAELALADGMSEEVAWAARAEAVLCAAASGETDTPQRFADLPPAPDATFGALRRDVIGERVVVALVNAGHYELAEQMVDATGIGSRPWADPDVVLGRSASQRDALFCLAVLDSQSHSVPRIERSRGRFSGVRRMLRTADGDSGPDGLFAAAGRGEAAAIERLRQHAEAPAPDDTSPHYSAS